MTYVGGSVVFVRKGSVYANSRDVAAYFEKEHRHVLRDIDSLISEASGCAPNFGETYHEVHGPNGGSRKSRSYDMDRDGFTLLAMSFTGPKIAALISFA